MPDSTLVFVAAAFLLAGAVKGVIGLGLPTISLGILAVVMTPLQAAAILIVPSVVTNLWQMLVGPGLGRIVKRVWPMMLGVCAGVWAGSGLMTGSGARYGSALLGAALIVYAIIGLSAARLTVARAREAVLGPIVGVVTGMITAATGVFVIPAVPYLQAIGFEKDELVQALGLSFMVSTLALGASVASNGALTTAIAVPSAVALVAACVGMWIGQALRARLSGEAFKRAFFIALLALGGYLVLRAALW